MKSKAPTLTEDQAATIARDVKAFSRQRNLITGKVRTDQESPFAGLMLNKADVTMVLRYMVAA